MYKAKLFFLLLILFSTYSCVPDTDINSNKLNTDNDAARAETPIIIPFSCEEGLGSLEVKNANNPHDEIGQLHNQGMNFIAEHFPYYPGDEFNLEELLRIMHSLNEYSANQGNITLEERFIERMSRDIWNDIEGDLITDVYLAEGLISNELYSTFAQIDKQFLWDYEIGNLEDVQTILNQLKDVEETILVDPKLSPAEKEAALISASTARYSLVFWTCQYLSNATFADLFNQEAAGFRWRCWQFFVEFDSSDARNALVCGATGALMGPGGAAAGGFVGGVAGSVGTGVSNAVSNGPCH